MPRVEAAVGKQVVPLRFGVGCEFSDYSSLRQSVLDATTGSDAPSFRILQDSGLGKGVYVLQFTHFNLPSDDYVLLRAKNVDKNSKDTQVLAGRNTTGSFFSAPIVGEGFILELYQQQQQSSSNAPSPKTSSGSDQSCLGFEVNGVVFAPQEQAEAIQDSNLAIGLPSVIDKQEDASSEQAEKFDEGKESVCGEDESQEAVCFEQSSNSAEQVMYKTSGPVARLMIRKDNNMNVAYCTGFLLGCEGHLITNQHCIRNWLDALNTYIEFYAQTETCGSKACETRGACPGRITAGNATLTAVSTDLDYALIKISSGDGADISTLFAHVGGYLQLRASGPKLQEEIFIPQYPLGQGKRIATTSNGQPGRIESLTAGECGGEDAGYYVDTQEGSSGSPVIAKSDFTVIALHHCGGCLNGGIQSQKLIADLETKGVLPRCAIAST
uniref:Serine protease n=1 Tax=Globisporangium ultimum (strain ATCC 200006 / CBS 805.95 / DAOM BR144) TaxID=431595 RepID=K3WB07_GLOUD